MPPRSIPTDPDLLFLKCHLPFLPSPRGLPHCKLRHDRKCDRGFRSRQQEFGRLPSSLTFFFAHLFSGGTAGDAPCYNGHHNMGIYPVSRLRRSSDTRQRGPFSRRTMKSSPAGLPSQATAALHAAMSAAVLTRLADFQTPTVLRFGHRRTAVRDERRQSGRQVHGLLRKRWKPIPPPAINRRRTVSVHIPSLIAHVSTVVVLQRAALVIYFDPPNDVLAPDHRHALGDAKFRARLDRLAA